MMYGSTCLNQEEAADSEQDRQGAPFPSYFDSIACFGGAVPSFTELGAKFGLNYWAGSNFGAGVKN